MTDFGDSEPEDSWHPDDPLPERLNNLRRRVILLAVAARNGTWGEREEIRAEDFDEDLADIIERLGADG